MGYNTTVLILNDGLSALEQNPEQFVKDLVATCTSFETKFGGVEVSAGNHCNPVSVQRTEHADVFRMYGSHGNLLVDMETNYALLNEVHRSIYDKYLERCTRLLEEVTERRDRVLRREDAEKWPGPQ